MFTRKFLKVRKVRIESKNEENEEAGMKQLKETVGKFGNPNCRKCGGRGWEGVVTQGGKHRLMTCECSRAAMKIAIIEEMAKAKEENAN